MATAKKNTNAEAPVEPVIEQPGVTELPVEEPEVEAPQVAPPAAPATSGTKVITAKGGSKTALQEQKLNFKFSKGKKTTLSDGTVKYEH